MIGNMEHGYLSSLGAEARFKALDDYLSHDVVAVVVTTSLDIFPRAVHAGAEARHAAVSDDMADQRVYGRR